METRAETLRRQIDLYRRYLREGVELRLAEEYLRRLKYDRAELAEIERTLASAGRKEGVSPSPAGDTGGTAP